MALWLLPSSTVPCTHNLPMQETIAPPQKASRCLRYGWFVAIVMAMRLLVEPAGEARAQASFPSVYDSDDADSDTAPDPSATSAQAQTSPWSQLSKAWDSVRNQVSKHGLQFGIRYDGEAVTTWKVRSDEGP